MEHSCSTLSCRKIVPASSLVFYSSDLMNTQRRMSQWVITGILFQLFSTRSEGTPSYSAKKFNGIFGILKSSELDNSVGSTVVSKFEYPKEDTTHGVGYGHHLHPFYYQGFPPLYSCALQGEWHPIVQHAYHSSKIQNQGRSMSIMDGDNYNPYLYSSDYTVRTNANDRRIVTPEHHLKHYLDGSTTIFTLKRADNTLDSAPQERLNKKYKGDLLAPEKQTHHSSHTYFKSGNKTAASPSNENNKIPTYLTPPLPPISLRDVVAQLQQLLPHRRHFNVRNDHKLVDILTTLHILPHPEETDYF